MTNFDFGANLRAMRQEKGLTQEQAAELLNVSKQSVSRWENGITYPDISFLPRLASFYGVTVDALLGADEAGKQAVLAEYASAHGEAHHRGDTAGAYELSRALCARLPNEHEAMNDLMNDAYLRGIDSEGEPRRQYLSEALAAAERFLKMTDDLEERCRCIRTGALCCKLLGRPEEARKWLGALPSVWSGIELCAMEVLEGPELQDHLRCTLRDFTDILQKLIFASAEQPGLSDEDRQRMLEKLLRFLELLFEEGDYGLFTRVFSRAYTRLALLADGTKAREAYASRALETATAFDELTAGIHRSILFRGLAYSPMEATQPQPVSQTEAVERQLAVLRNAD